MTTQYKTAFLLQLHIVDKKKGVFFKTVLDVSITHHGFLEKEKKIEVY
jgi:hypothetical protein